MVTRHDIKNKEGFNSGVPKVLGILQSFAFLSEVRP